MNRDFREQGPRRALNLGHTLGHALEAWSQGTDQPLSHGEAVAIGMAVVFRIAAERGTCPLASGGAGDRDCWKPADCPPAGFPLPATSWSACLAETRSKVPARVSGGCYPNRWVA